MAASYDADRGGEERGERIAGELEPHFSARSLTLDIGAGTGVVGLALGHRGRRVLGIDLSRQMLRRAASRTPGQVALADATRLPFAESTFDDAYSVWVLHVVGDPVAVMREALRVIRPGGRYLVHCNARHGADAISELVGPLIDRLSPERRSREKATTIASFGEQSGFRLLEIAVGPAFLHSTTAQAEANIIERRGTSVYFDVDEARWSREVIPVIRALRSLPPEPIDRTLVHDLVVLERP